MGYWSVIGLLLVFYIAYLFLKNLGKNLPIIELLFLIAGLQWIVGPIIEYKLDYGHYKYYMYVNESEYMSYVVPGLLIFFLLAQLVKRKAAEFNHNLQELGSLSKYGMLILIIGLASDVLQSVVPSALLFFVYLTSLFKYVGVIILFFSEVKWHRKLFYLAVVYLAISSLQIGFFHEFILWSAFFYMFWAFKKKPSLKFNIMVLVVGFVVSTAIQAVKAEYRLQLSGNASTLDYVSLFSNLLSQRLSGGLTEDTNQQGELNVRLNQGWIISAIMDHTPRVQAFAKGETVMEALTATALPRFLSPNKKMAGGVENFERFTGLPLAENTSMGMSVIGEAYANYGKTGGIIFMAFWGLFLGFYWKMLMKFIQKNLLLLFFLPLLFFQVVKAETELVVVLNHLVKSSIVVGLFLWLLKKAYPLKTAYEA